MTEQKPIRVMLADDHPIVMTGFAMSLAGVGMDVVGQAKTPDEAASMYAELQPDVMVMDIRFGTELTGLDAAEVILKKFPSAKIVFLSQFDQDSLIKETYRIGARAFVTKDCDPADLATAVWHAAEGKLYFLPQIAERLANLSVRGDASPQRDLFAHRGVRGPADLPQRRHLVALRRGHARRTGASRQIRPSVG